MIKHRKIKILTIILAMLAICCISSCKAKIELSGEEPHIITTSAQTQTAAASVQATAAVPETTTPAPETTAPAQPEEKKISFLFCPDNIIHPCVYYDALEIAAAAKSAEPDYSADKLAAADYSFAGMYSLIADKIASADYAYVNVETMMGGGNIISGYPLFNTPLPAGETLIELGFDIYNLAHNHMLDSLDDEYLINCNNFFTSRGKTVLGYYKNEEATNDITVIEAQGVIIALLSYTFSTNQVTLNSSAETYIPYINTELITRQMKKARAECDLVFVNVHWGNENTFTLRSSQESTAQLLVDLGADVIIGLHPHVIQEMKWVTRDDGTRCLLTYSLGNMISGMRDGFNMLGGMLEYDVSISKTGSISVENVYFDPIVTHYVMEKAVKSDDRGFREFKIYPLELYTEELAAAHGVHLYEAENGATLWNGAAFSLESLKNTVKEVIPSEFLRTSQ